MMEEVGHLNEYVDPLDIDKPGYYTPKHEEIYLGCMFDIRGPEGIWSLWNYLSDNTPHGSFIKLLNEGHVRMRYLQASDIMSLGFGRIAQSLPMYQHGSYTITAYRLLDPTYSRLNISQNGVRVYEGHVKNKSELKRVLILNEINFVES